MIESFKFDETPWFPITINIGTPTIAITLNADGSWSGDIAAFRQAMAESKGRKDGVQQVLLWLLLREMERDDAERFR